MIKATSTIKHGKNHKVLPGLLLARSNRFLESGYRNSFVMKTRNGRQLIVADLHNRYFPLDLKTIILDSGIYLAVSNFALFVQPHGLFLTSQDRVMCRKFDDTPGIMLAGQCQRFFDDKGDLFTFNGVPVIASLS
jgi:hypothetical protein